MSGTRALRVLVVDDDPVLVEDYRYILAPDQRSARSTPFPGLEGDILGAARGHKRFPKLELIAQSQGYDAVDSVRAALEADNPFAIAFLDLQLTGGLEGLCTAEEIRTLDPDLHIVLVSGRSEVHPVELSERVPPADRLFFARKPFHAAEIQQLVLALGARWRAERRYGSAQRSGLGHGSMGEMLEAFPGGMAIFDRRDRLIVANDNTRKLFPELAELFVAGTPYEEIQRQIAEHLSPENRLVRIDAWLRDRLAWHVQSGGAIEQKLRGDRWILLIEKAMPSGGTCCWYYDITPFKKREIGRAMASHMRQMAQSFAVLCDQLDALALGAKPARDTGSPNRRTHGAVSVLPGLAATTIGGTGWDGALAGRLAAVAQQQKLNAEPVELNQVVANVVRRLRAEAPPGVEMEVVTGAGLWPALIDTEKFGVALTELLRNGFDAMLGGGRLTVETVNLRLSRDFAATRVGLSSGEYVRISVQDSGPGMSPDLVERAWNPFFTSKDRTRHLGLGLSAAYGFVQQSGGYIEIDGGQARGVTVDVYFPRAEPGVVGGSADADTQAGDAAARSGVAARRRRSG